MRRLLGKLFSHPTPPTPVLPTIKSVVTTPSFVIDTQIVGNRLRDLRLALDQFNIKSKIAFSFKTNYDFAVSNFLHQHSLLAETVSEYEYQLAKKSGFLAKNIIINGPNKGQLSRYLPTNSIIHLDNIEEVSQVESSKTHPTNIGIRVNTINSPSRFGFNLENGEAGSVIERLRHQNIRINSLHIHLGSDIYDYRLYQKAALSIAQFINQSNLKVETIDFGGGFAAHGRIPYGRRFVPTPDINQYIGAISTLFQNIDYQPQLILEPGRYLIDDATAFVTKAVSVKSKKGTQIITVDSAITMLPSLWYRPPTIDITDPFFTTKNTHHSHTIIYGSSCQEHDVLYTGSAARITVGDLIIFYHVGAYNQSMAPQFIFPIPPTQIV